jgi:hypothetical protein
MSVAIGMPQPACGRQHHAPHRTHHRQGGFSHAGQGAVLDLVFDLETDHEEKHGHEGVVDEVLQ